MELSDYWGTVNGFIDNGNDGFGQNVGKTKPGTKLISISSVDLLTKSNYQDFQRFQSIDVSMPGDAEATLPSPGMRRRSARRASSWSSMRRSRISTGRWSRHPAIPATGRTGCGRWKS